MCIKMVHEIIDFIYQLLIWLKDFKESKKNIYFGWLMVHLIKTEKRAPTKIFNVFTRHVRWKKTLFPFLISYFTAKINANSLFSLFFQSSSICSGYGYFPSLFDISILIAGPTSVAVYQITATLISICFAPYPRIISSHIAIKAKMIQENQKKKEMKRKKISESSRAFHSSFDNFYF